LQEKILAEQAKAETKGTSFVDAEKEMLKNDPISMCLDKFLQLLMDIFL